MLYVIFNCMNANCFFEIQSYIFMLFEAWNSIIKTYYIYFNLNCCVIINCMQILSNKKKYFLIYEFNLKLTNICILFPISFKHHLTLFICFRS